MCKAIYFDMDGTIADLYGVQNWEYKLNHDDVTPYQEARPLVDMKELNHLLVELSFMGVKIGVVSWLAMNSNKAYDKATRKAKREWLKRHLPIATEVHLVKYGTNKNYPCKEPDAVLVDDNAAVRAKWKGKTIDASNPQNILKSLREVLDNLKQVA